MRISGFSFLRNGAKLGYPFVESVRSALDLVDEFVVALGDGDPDDDSRERLEALDSDKLVIVDTVWDLAKFRRGTEHAHQTDIAKQRCSGDWLLYLQGDEVLHEDDHDVLRERCERYQGDRRIEGMVFDYLHFWGDYDHVHDSHAWYRHEIRMVRNDPEIHSFKSAQSFRRIPAFDGISYREKKGTQKLACVHSGARIFHYGWVRPPEVMSLKCEHFDLNHSDQGRQRLASEGARAQFDYGPLDTVPRFRGTHPAVMAERVDQARKHGPLPPGTGQGSRVGRKHLMLRNRVLTWVENNLLSGRNLFSSKNYRLLR